MEQGSILVIATNYGWSADDAKELRRALADVLDPLALAVSNVKIISPGEAAVIEAKVAEVIG